MTSIAIVGAGMAGLTCARRLRAAGFGIAVFEAGRPGGVIRTRRVDGFVCEDGPSSFLRGVPGGVGELCDELGVAVEPAARTARRRWIFVDGKLRVVPTSPRALVTTDLLDLRGKLRLLAEPLARRRPADREETAAELFRRRLGEQALRRLAAPYTTGVFAADPAELSAAAAFPTLAALDADGGFVVGGVKRMWRSRGGPRRPRGLAAPRGGFAPLVAALAADLGDALRPLRPVAALAPDGAGVALAFAGGAVERFDAVVLAVPAPRAPALLEASWPALAAELGGFASAPAAVVHLGYPRAAIEHPLDGFGFLVAAGEPLRLLGCVFESALWSGRAPAGAALLRCIFGGARDPAAAALDDAALIAHATADLGRALGRLPTPTHASVARADDGLAQYRPGHGERLARAEAIAASARVVLAGASYHGVGLNGVASDAARVVDRVRALGLSAAALGLTAAAFVTLALGACSCGGPTPGDAGPSVPAVAPTPAPPPPPRPEPPPTPVPGATTGEVEITVQWIRPPPALLASPGLTACGSPRRPPLAAGGLGGVADALVTLESAPPSPGAAIARAGQAGAVDGALTIERCRFDRAALVLGPGGVLEVTTRDDRRHAVALERLDAAAGPSFGALDLALIGQRRQVVLPEPGRYRLTLADGERAYVHRTGAAPARLTPESGVVAWPDVPPGRHRVSLWHPPLADGQPAVALTAELDVAAGLTARHTFDLARAR